MKIVLALLGAMAGFVFGGAAAAAVVFMAAGPEKNEVNREWALASLIVATEDLSVGQEVTFELISSRTFPEKCRTSPDLMDPDAAAEAMGKVLTVPLPRGAALRYTHLAEKPPELDGGTQAPGDVPGEELPADDGP